VQAVVSIKIWSRQQARSLGTACKHVFKSKNAPFTATFTKGECPAPLKCFFEPWCLDLGQERNKFLAPVSSATCPQVYKSQSTSSNYGFKSKILEEVILKKHCHHFCHIDIYDLISVCRVNTST